MDTRISNIRRIDSAYNTMEKKAERIKLQLSDDYEDFFSRNPYYRKVSMGSVVFSAVADIAVLALIIYYRITLAQRTDGAIADSGTVLSLLTGFFFDKNSLLPSLITILMVMLLGYCLYRTAVLIYCRRIELYGESVEKLNTEIDRRIGNAERRVNLRLEMIEAVQNKQEYTLSSENDIGDKIIALRKGFADINQKTRDVRKYVSFGLAGAAYLMMILYILIKVNTGFTISVYNGMGLMLLYLVMTAMLHLVQFTLGQYMSGFAKAAGMLMAVVYGLFLGIALKREFAIPAIEMAYNKVPGLNRAFLVVPVIQVLGMLLTIAASHYGLEKEKWRDGFSVAMRYGAKDDGNKKTLLWRGGLAVFLALIMCGLFAYFPLNGIVIALILSFLWYASNTLLKPRGSYLYAFWGRNRAIANEFVMAAMVFTSLIGSRGTIWREDLIMLGVILVLTLPIAGLATWVNNKIY